MPNDQDRMHKPTFSYAYTITIVLLLACGSVVAVPFISNQNQYFAHALSSMNANVRSDWFINTIDPYPFFSSVAKSIYEWFGIYGIRICALLGTTVAITAVFWLAYHLVGRPNLSNVAILGTVAVGLTLPPHINAFEGVGGQYIISTPAYLQPSMFGCFILLAIPCLLAALSTNNRDVKILLLAAAFVLAALGCALHPTYMVSALILLAAIFFANIWQGDKSRITYLTFAAIALVAVSVAANPALLSMAISSPEYNRAAQRFAFERIPQHTALVNWKYADAGRFIIMLVSVPIAAKKLKRPWLAYFLSACLIIGSAATLLIQLMGQAKLALLFPWRVSVFITPISFTILAVWIAGYVEQAVPQWNWRRVALVFASIAGLYGVIGTLRAESPTESDERTAFIKAVHPLGVGLVPLGSENLRLNAAANIYVDLKSPPYASDDLIEWWQRVDQVSEFEHDADRYCSIKWHVPIRWILLPAARKTPLCASKWKVVRQTAKWRVLEKY